MRWAKWLLILAVPVILLPVTGDAASNVTKRDLGELLAAQGSVTSFFSHPDIGGWADGEFINFTLIDYPGVIAKWLYDEYGIDLGTSVEGTVMERAISPDAAKFTVKLRAKNALGFAQSIQALIDNGFDFKSTDTVFGNKAIDVGEDGAEAALGWAHLDMSFTMPPGSDLPDLIDVISNAAAYAPAKLSFISTVFGKDPDGNPLKLRVEQVGSIAAGDADWTYTKEVVDLKEAGRK